MTSRKILKMFPTERYKRFFYPTRPLFTLFQGLVLLSLGLTHVLPMSWALWLSAAFAFDDLPLTPIMSIVTAINNLANGRKRAKSLIIIIAITLTALIGGCLGFFVVSHIPVFMTAVASFIELTSCSPLLISIGIILGGLFAHFTKKINSFVGMTLGILVASFVPIKIPLLVDIVFTCSALPAFIVSVVSKQCLRLYYKYRYGHSNADGYKFNNIDEKQAEFIDKQANKFNVSPSQFKNLTNACIENIKITKEKATVLEEYSSKRHLLTNSFKDIYHLLMDENLIEPEDLSSARELLKETTNPANKMIDSAERDLLLIKKTLSTTLQTDFNLRQRFHCIQINSVEPGLTMELTAPFCR